MCGIAGLLGPPLQAPGQLGSEVGAMIDTLAHRGPDDQGTWVDEEAGIALGHRRLSVIDISPLGHQPMMSSSGRWVASYNGEIYNFGEVRRCLEARGRHFRGHSDTEVLVEAVDEWGFEPTLRRLNAMFAMAVWDRQSRRLYLARDRLGEKPLYWGWVGRRLAFASELKAIRAVPGFSARVDHDVLALYLRHNCVPAPYGIYEDTGKLLPGQFMTIEADDVARRRLPSADYWSAAECVDSGRASRVANPADAVDQVAELLDDAVNIRCFADVPVGALLSGGIDSSLVVALMRQHSSMVRTFTVGFDDPRYDESLAARAVAQHLGTDHVDIKVTPSEVLDVVPRLADLYDEPFSDSSQLPTVLVAELARRHVTVVLSGDGGDELFAGYNRHDWASRFAPRLERVPLAARRWMAAGMGALPPAAVERSFQAVGRLIPAVGGLRNPSIKMAKAAQVLASADIDDAYLRLVSHWPEPTTMVPGSAEPTTLVTDGAGRLRLSDPVERMLYLDQMTYLPDDILTKVDRATMSVALEARVPMLDHRLVELSWRLPMDYKLRDHQTKWVLRTILERFVPPTLFDRPKMGFGIPLGSWLRRELRPWAEELLAPSRLRAEGYFEPNAVRRAWEAHLSGRADHSHALWDVLVFQDWAARWLS